jgi:hypothetical protein
MRFLVGMSLIYFSLFTFSIRLLDFDTSSRTWPWERAANDLEPSRYCSVEEAIPLLPVHAAGSHPERGSRVSPVTVVCVRRIFAYSLIRPHV